MLTDDTWILLQEALQRQGEVKVLATGQSMRPGIKTGDRLVVAPIGPDGPRIGEVIVFRSGDRLLAHRLVAFASGGHLLTRGDARWFCDPPIPVNALLGRVTGIERAGMPQALAPRGLPALERGLGPIIERLVTGRDKPHPDVPWLTLAVGQILELSQKRDPIVPQNPQSVQASAAEARLAALFAHADARDVTADLIDFGVTHQRATLARTLVFEKALAELAQPFGQAGVAAILLKGPIHAALVYPRAGMRPMVDLDLLIRPEHADAADAVLTACGYTKEASEWSNVSEKVVAQRSYIRQDTLGLMTIELHHHLGVLSERMPGLGVSTEGAWQRTRPAGTHPGFVRLEDGDLLAYACTHWLQHHFPFSIWLVDIALMCRHLPIDWQILASRAQREGTRWAIAAPLLVIDALWEQALPAQAQTFLDQLPPLRRRLLRVLVWRHCTRHLSEHLSVASLGAQLLVQPSLGAMLTALYRGLLPTTAWLSHHFQAPVPENRVGNWRLRLAYMKKIWRL